MSLHTRRLHLLGGAATVVLGAGIVLVWGSHVTAPDATSLGRVLGLLATIGLGVPLIAGGGWLARDPDLERAEVVRLLAWCVVATVPLLAFTTLTIAYQRQHGVALAEQGTVLLWVAGTGVLGGFVTGIHEVRRCRSSRRLQETAKRLTALFDAAPVPVIEHDTDGVVRRWNDAAEQVFGWETESVLGNRLPFLTDSSDVDYESLLDRLEAGETVSNVEVQRRTSDGEVRDLLLSSAPVLDDRGERVESVIDVLVDVTERKARMQRLSLFRTLVDHSTDSVFVVDIESGRFVDVNRTACECLGYDAEELHSMHVTDVEEDFESEADWEDHTERLREQGSLVVEGTHRRADGSRFPVEVTITHVELDREYSIAIARDLSERKQREQELQLFRRAVDHAGHAVFITDPDGTIEYANPAFEEVTGYSPGEAVGEQPSILKSGEHEDAYYDELWNTITAGEVWEADIVNQRRSGEIYTARQTIAPIQTDGCVAGYVAIQSDKTAETVRDQRLGVFHRILRHNLRNTVNVQYGQLELLEREIDDPELLGHLETLRRHAAVLEDLSGKARVVENALDESNESAGPRPVADIVGDVVERFRQDDRPMDLGVDLRTDETVRIEPGIEPAVRELIENAIDHNDREQPVVRVTSRPVEAGSKVAIEVADNGPGVPDNEIETLRNGEERPLSHASGLGLWLVKWVTRSLGGTVGITDSEPRGSVVTLTLPAYTRCEDASQTEAGPSVRNRRAIQRIQWRDVQ